MSCNGCRCCIWHYRRIAVPSGDHVLAHRMWRSGETPRDKCLGECESLSRWIDGRWGAGGYIDDDISDNAQNVIGRVYETDLEFLRKHAPGELVGVNDFSLGEIAAGPLGVYAIRTAHNVSSAFRDHLVTYAADGSVLATSTDISGAGIPWHGIVYDSSGNLWYPLFANGFHVVGIDPSDHSGVASMSYLPVSPNDYWNVPRLFRPRYDRTTGYICCATRVFDSAWTGYPLDNPISNRTGWVGFGGSVAWRVRVGPFLEGWTHPTQLSVYAQSDLVTPIATFYPFKDNPSGSPGVIYDCDVDESGRLVVVGRNGCRKNVHVYDADGSLILTVGYGAEGSDPDNWSQAQPTCCCWAPTEDEIIVGGDRPKKFRWPYPGDEAELGVCCLAGACLDVDCATCESMGGWWFEGPASCPEGEPTGCE